MLAPFTVDIDDEDFSDSHLAEQLLSGAPNAIYSSSHQTSPSFGPNHTIPKFQRLEEKKGTQAKKNGAKTQVKLRDTTATLRNQLGKKQSFESRFRNNTNNKDDD